MPALSLSDLYLYPVKSLAGIRVKQWPVTATGLLHDRKWMLIDSENCFLSQRKLPKMALIKPSLVNDLLILDAPNMPSLSIPLYPVGGNTVQTTIWHDQCQSKTVSAEANKWFSRFLGRPCQLVYQPESNIRSVDPDYATDNDQVSYADGFPFLIATTASLANLNESMSQSLSMQRFRPNLVISGCHAYAEDSWREINVDSITFKLPKPCSRCSVPGINPETAHLEKETLSRLNQLRNWKNKVYFGQNAVHEQQGILSVGDRVEVIQTGDAQPPLLVSN